MPVNDYNFVDRWRVKADVKEVADILEDALSLPRWWPSVYFEVQELEPGGEHGIDKLISLRAGGWLPYSLRINFRTTESRYPHGFTMEATGDLEGRGIWTFAQDGPFVNVTYDWTIRANKPVIEKLSFLLKPIFRSNPQLDYASGRRESETGATATTGKIGRGTRGDTSVALAFAGS